MNHTVKCKQCLDYFETDDDYSDFCSERCSQEYEYAYEDSNEPCCYEDECTCPLEE